MRKKMHSSSENISRGDSLSPSDLYRIGMQILKLQQLLCHLEENWPENDDNILRQAELRESPQANRAGIKPCLRPKLNLIFFLLWTIRSLLKNFVSFKKMHFTCNQKHVLFIRKMPQLIIAITKWQVLFEQMIMGSYVLLLYFTESSNFLWMRRVLFIFTL